MKNPRGVTLIEVVIVIVVTVVLASAFSSVFVPTMNLFFYYPQSSRVNSAAADLLQIIFEGDNLAKGLRYTGGPCAVGGGGGGGSTLTAASTTSLTYNYTDSDYCGNGARTSHTVVLTLDTTNDIVTRAVDGGSAVPIPYYVTTSSEIDFNAPGGGVNFFHYYDAAGTDLGGTPTTTSVYRVDVNVIATSGSGRVQHDAGQIRLHGGAEIRRHTT